MGASAQRAHTYVLISGIYLRRDNLPGGAQKIVGERVLYILKGVYWRFVIGTQKASNTFYKNIVNNKVTIDAYGYDIHTYPAVLGRCVVISA